ncbi:MAG: glycosyltransferase family 8 protein [Ruminococcaceae bacterium]|nr:glycosyltransferase family 8 protein [Oscillospiraceae bacterium]
MIAKTEIINPPKTKNTSRAKKTEKNTVNVFFASDRNYLPYLAVAIQSLSSFANKKYFYNVRILSEDLTLESLCGVTGAIKPNVKISVFSVADKISSIKEELALRLRDYYSDAIYYRIFIAEMFPTLKRAVYLDSDIVLNEDIAKLYFTNIGEKLLGAVTDESVMAADVFREYVKKHVRMKKAEDYFNSGVLVMNLEKMREEKIKDQFINLLCKYNFKTVAPDQDYLNFLCRGKIHYLDRGWNKHAIAENEIENKDLYLMHYNMFNKPWKYDGVQNEELFWNFASKTSFAEFLENYKQKYNDRKKKKDGEAAKKLLSSAKTIAESNGISFRKKGKILC